MDKRHWDNFFDHSLDVRIIVYSDYPMCVQKRKKLKKKRKETRHTRNRIARHYFRITSERNIGSLQSSVKSGVGPPLKLSTRDFSPLPAVYRPRETAFSPLSSWPLFAIHPSVGFTFGLALALVLVLFLFPAALFPCPPKRNEYTRLLCPTFCNSGERS